MIFQNLKTLHLVYRNYIKDFFKIKTKNDKTYFFMQPPKALINLKQNRLNPKKQKRTQTEVSNADSLQTFKFFFYSDVKNLFSLFFKFFVFFFLFIKGYARALTQIIANAE